MPICQNCYANLPENAVFCNKCGQRVHQPVQQAVQPAQQAYQPVQQAVQPSQQVYQPAQPVQTVQQFVPQQNYTARRMHCPNCKSTNIQISTESSVNGGVTAHHGGFSTTSVSNTHRNFWFCSDCGTKFRNIQNLEDEIAKSKNSHILFFLFAGISLCLFIFFLVKILDNPIGAFFFGFFTFACAVSAIVFTIVGFVSKSKVGKMKKELEWLQQACFN